LSDIWFTRYKGNLWFAWAAPGKPPSMFPMRVSGVGDAFKIAKRAGIEIGQVGIGPNDMLGLV